MNSIKPFFEKLRAANVCSSDFGIVAANTGGIGTMDDFNSVLKKFGLLWNLITIK